MSRVTIIQITNNIINQVNQIGKEEDGIFKCTDMFKKATLDNLDYSEYNVGNDDNNASAKIYVFNEDKFDAELDNENKLDEQQAIKDEEL